MRSRGISQTVRTTKADVSGSFRIEGEVDGDYSIGVVGRLQGNTFKIDAKVKLDKGEVPWEHTITTSRLKR